MYKISKMMNFSTVAALWVGALICSAAGCAEPPQPQAPEEREAQEVKPAEPLSTILATKLVGVCGRRPYPGQPQSWWVDSGIYVQANAVIGVDHSLAGSGIKPWLNGPAYSPAGIQGGPNWTESIAYQAGQRNPAHNVAFALIGKIGLKGLPFLIGNATSFTAQSTGTLYLAFNDGVNFDDNEGLWNIRLSFPGEVSLGVGHDDDTVFADRVNASLVSRWGVVLTVDANNGFPDHNVWTPTYIRHVELALAAIEARLNRPFKDVFGGVELRLVASETAGGTAVGFPSVITLGRGARDADGRIDNRNWGQVSPPSALNFYPAGSRYGLANWDDPGIRNTLIHELGHLLEYRTRNAASPRARMHDLATSFDLKRMKQSDLLYEDSADDLGVFWESKYDVNSQVEIVADQFLNWVRDSFVGQIGSIDSPPVSLTPEQRRIARFWSGGTQNAPGGIFTSPGWAGTDGFRAAVMDYVIQNSIPGFLDTLGYGDPATRRGGDPDPGCLYGEE
jgi:hypothetical protein